MQPPATARARAPRPSALIARLGDGRAPHRVALSRRNASPTVTAADADKRQPAAAADGRACTCAGVHTVAPVADADNCAGKGARESARHTNGRRFSGTPARTHARTHSRMHSQHSRTHARTNARAHSRTHARARALTHARTLGTSARARPRTLARAGGQADRAGRGRTVFGRGRGMAREAGCVALTVTAVGCARPVSELLYASWGMRGQHRTWRGCALHVTPWRGAWCPKQPGPVKTGQPAGFGAGGHESAEQRSCRRQCVCLSARLFRIVRLFADSMQAQGRASAMGIGSWHSSSVPCCAQTDVLGVLSAGRSCQRANRNRSGIPRGS